MQAYIYYGFKSQTWKLIILNETALHFLRICLIFKKIRTLESIHMQSLKIYLENLNIINCSVG